MTARVPVAGSRLRWLPRVGVVAAALLVAPAPLDAQSRHVLVLYGERSALPGIEIIDRGLSEELERRLGDDLHLYREDLDVSRFDDSAHVERFTTYLASKYADIPIDVVVPVMEPAVDVALLLRDVAFDERIPIVFWRLGANPPPELPPNVTGAFVHVPFARTLELALELHPETDRVVVVTGESRFDRDLRRVAQRDLRPFEDRLDISFPAGLSMDSIAAMVSGLPARTVVLYGTILRDAAGRPYVARDAARIVSEASAAPVYGLTDLFLGTGIVGGRMHSLQGNGETVGELAALSLELGVVPPPVDLPSGAAMLDARQLERWRIPEGRLPADADVLLGPSSWFGRNWVLVAAVAAMLLEGAIIAALLVHRRKRLQAEARAHENETRFRTLADRVPVMIWMTGGDSRLEFLNRTWLDFAGSSLGEQVDERWTDRVHPEDRQRCDDAMERSLASGDDFSLECRMRRHDGAWRWMLCNGVTRTAPDGTVLGQIGSCFDITRRRRAELADQRHAEELARVSRVATMGAFTASIAHELNQPLTAILSNAEAAARFLARTDPPMDEVRDTLGDIAKDGQRAGQIIRRMRSLLGRHEVARTDLELNSVVCEVLSLVRLEAMARRVDIDFEPEGLEVFARGDRVHVQQVLMNLVLNAFEAMDDPPPGGPRVAIRTRQASEDVSEISVTDNGPGVPVEDLPHLFDPFFTTKNDGLGMGLSISRTIVEAHEGELLVENRPEGGATFRLRLPRA